jgi:hypothetical protein
VVAAEQRPDDLDGLGEHLVPDVHRRPAAPDDVLVEVLPRAEAVRRRSCLGTHGDRPAHTLDTDRIR